MLDVEDLFGNQTTALLGLKRTEDAYNGLSLTFTSGTAKGITTRIIDYLPPTLDEPGDEDYVRDFARFRLLSFRQVDGSTLPQNDNELNRLLAGSRFVVNGRPFNGTGVGLNPNVTPNPTGPPVEQQACSPHSKREWLFAGIVAECNLLRSRCC